LQESV
jgi:hypothetical protein